MEKRTVLSLGYSTLSLEEAAVLVLRAAREGRALSVFTPGATVAAAAQKDGTLLSLLKQADLLLPDGVGCALASRLAGAGELGTVAGIELAERLLSLAAKEGMRIFFYGGKGGVALRAAERMLRKYPNLKIACADGYGEDPIEKITAFRPQLLFVCLGFPRQERWIASHKPILSCPALGLGGTFDVWSGDLRRAPPLIRRMGLEWLWRTLRQPRRLARLLPLPRYFAACARAGALRFLQNFQKKRKKTRGSRKM